jgi:uncharacterized damage-inducible protein DinB
LAIRTSFERLLAHDRWASGRSIDSLEALGKPPAKALELMGHLLGAEACWLDRMTVGRDPADWERWEAMDVAALRRAWRDELPARWASFLADAAASAPRRTFTYVNFLGDTGTARVEDALVQLMLHSSYHRGQVASLVRAAGGTPAVVDFIPAVRAGAIPEGDDA